MQIEQGSKVGSFNTIFDSVTKDLEINPRWERGSTIGTYPDVYSERLLGIVEDLPLVIIKFPVAYPDVYAEGVGIPGVSIPSLMIKAPVRADVDDSLETFTGGYKIVALWPLSDVKRAVPDSKASLPLIVVFIRYLSLNPFNIEHRS